MLIAWQQLAQSTLTGSKDQTQSNNSSGHFWVGKPFYEGVTIDYHINFIYLFIYFWFYVAFNTVQVISRRVVGRAEETSTYSSLGFCTVNCRPTASNYQLSHMRPCRESNPGLRGGRRECYHSATMAPDYHIK